MFTAQPWLTESSHGFSRNSRRRFSRFLKLWYTGTSAINGAIGYAEHRSRSHNAVIRVYDETGNVIETHEHARDFKEW
jgi:hypothetical protein